MVIGDPQRDVMRGKQLQHVILLPARMAKFERVAIAARQHPKKIGQPPTIRLEPRGQLKRPSPWRSFDRRRSLLGFVNSAAAVRPACLINLARRKPWRPKDRMNPPLLGEPVQAALVDLHM
jgi:hypothetical protein